MVHSRGVLDRRRVGFNMTLDDVRKLLLRKCRPFISGHGNSRTGIKPWCKAHCVNTSHASDFLNGNRNPTSDLLEALGLEWRVMRKRAAP